MCGEGFVVAAIVAYAEAEEGVGAACGFVVWDDPPLDVEVVE